jgi:hypothetical protein
MTNDPVVRVTFKHEGEDAEPFGPVHVFRESELDDEGRPKPRPFDPNRQPDPWMGLSAAEKIAAEHGVELEQA